MSRFLDRVLQEKAGELARKRQACPLRELERRAAAMPVRNFRTALSGGRRIIAEIKRRSPSVDAFRQTGAPEQLAAIYEAGGAAAISIVTDERNFGTSLADVARVRKATALPILVKDFMTDPYQVIEARACGADAVLLITRILPSPLLTALLDVTRDLGISALVECHDEADVARAAGAGADIIGINNRDLATLDVSLETTRRLSAKIPEGAICVCESGINGRGQIEKLIPFGVDAFLVGGALLNAADPRTKLRELCGDEAPPPEAAGEESADG